MPSAKETKSNACICRTENGFDEPQLSTGAFPPAISWHSSISCVIPERLWTISGATLVKIPFGSIYSPVTMTIIKEKNTIVLVNSLRFSRETNAEIIALSGMKDTTVHIVRLGATHGKYDSFWKDHMGARGRLWTLSKHKLQTGLVSDEVLAPGNLPLENAECFTLEVGQPEAVLILKEKWAIFCDAVCNINSYQFFSWYARPLIKAAGFRSAVDCSSKRWNKWVVDTVGKEKVQQEYERLLGCNFDSYTTAHGPALVGDARNEIRKAMKGRLRVSFG